jgi:hypothetical protein
LMADITPHPYSSLPICGPHRRGLINRCSDPGEAQRMASLTIPAEIS